MGIVLKKKILKGFLKKYSPGIFAAAQYSAPVLLWPASGSQIVLILSCKTTQRAKTQGTQQVLFQKRKISCSIWDTNRIVIRSPKYLKRLFLGTALLSHSDYYVMRELPKKFLCELSCGHQSEISLVHLSPGRFSLQQRTTTDIRNNSATVPLNLQCNSAPLLSFTCRCSCVLFGFLGNKKKLLMLVLTMKSWRALIKK